MRKYVKLIALIIGIVALQGCATHQKFVQRYDSWIGRDINTLIAQVGYPDSTFTLPNNNKVYVYERSRTYSIPSGPMFGYGYYGYYPMFYRQEVVTDSCKLFIETDQKGKIVKWNSRGNRCVSN